MAYEQKDGQGSLFKNTEKETPNHADYTGSIKVGNVEYWLNGWIKQAKSGGKMFMSLSAKPKQAKAAAAPKAAVAGPDDDLPF